MASGEVVFAGPIQANGTDATAGISITGTGTALFTAPATYLGTTTVRGGTIDTSSTGTLGSGPLVISAGSLSVVVSLGSNQSLRRFRRLPVAIRQRRSAFVWNDSNSKSNFQHDVRRHVGRFRHDEKIQQRRVGI